MSKILISTWYRSTLANGDLWCESSNPEEVVRMSVGKDVYFQQLETYQVTTGWEYWDGSSR